MGADSQHSSTMTITGVRQVAEGGPSVAPLRRTEGDLAPEEAGRQRGRRLPLWAGEFALVAVLYVVYDTSRGLRKGNLAAANTNGHSILRWEQTLHLDPEHALNQLLWHIPFLAVTASYDYAALHFIITPAVLIWMYRRHPDHYRMARTALVIATVTALVIFFLLPTAPPRLLSDGGFHDILAHVHQWGWWSSEGSAPRGFGGLTNQLAAMPSLHVGWALWSGWLIARHAKRPVVRVLGAVYPVTTALVVMGTGNHYFFDTLGGVAVIAFGALIARAMSGHHLMRSVRADHPVQVRSIPSVSVIDATTLAATGTPSRTGAGNRSPSAAVRGRTPRRPHHQMVNGQMDGSDMSDSDMSDSDMSDSDVSDRGVPDSGVPDLDVSDRTLSQSGRPGRGRPERGRPARCRARRRRAATSHL